MQACCPCWRSWSSQTSRWCASAIMVEIDETEDENDGWPKVIENQTNHVVATGINRPVTVTIIYYVITIVWNNKDRMKIMVHGELNIYFSFHRKKLHFMATMETTIHEEKICHFTFHGKKKGWSQVAKIPFTTLFVWRRQIGIAFWCTHMATGNQQKHLEFTFSIKALFFSLEK